MNLAILINVAALACACTHDDRPVATAQIDGEPHVVVRVEAGNVWWARRAWSEPHRLWSLPARGDVRDLAVERLGDGFVVTFEQGGETWRGTFREGSDTPARLARGGK